MDNVIYIVITIAIVFMLNSYLDYRKNIMMIEERKSHSENETKRLRELVNGYRQNHKSDVSKD